MHGALVVYLGHGMCHPVLVLVFCPKSVLFLLQVLSSQAEEPQNKTVHLYGSTRHLVFEKTRVLR